MGEERTWIDHVILGDLEVAAKLLESEYGLFAWDSGVNSDLGTKSMVVSIRDEPTQYLEIVTVDNASKPYASLLSAVLANGDRLVGWAVGTDDPAVGTRLNIEPQEWHYTWPDGLKSTFRTIMAAEWGLPFFIQYDPPTDEETKVWEGRSIEWERQHERLGVKPLGISWVEVGGQEERIREWLGGPDLPIRYSGGPPGISAAGISTSAGEIVVR